MPLADDARNAGRAAAASARGLLAERYALLLRKDPELQATALETGLVDQAWLDDPGQVPVSHAEPLEVVERFLERSAERNPSFLARAGLGAIQLLSFRAEEPGDGSATELAVVFTDLEGFTQFTSRHGDEAAMDLLAGHHRLVSPIVRGRGGKVVKRIGDGLMLSFPEAAGAIHAAVELLDSTPTGMRLRAGVHYGEVVITRDDMIGHVVNVAARVTEAAKGGQALVTTAAAQAAGELHGVTLSRARRRSFKGIGEVVPVHRAERAERWAREPVTAAVDGRITAALHFQRESLDHASLSSPLYRALLDAVIADTEAGGPCAVVLAATPPDVRPIPDALALRFLGAVHRLVLAGAVPALARWFPTAGGAYEPGAGDPGPDLVAAVAAHEPELVAGLALGVQTNEVARCATLAVGFTELLRRFGLPLGLREIGSSAGLNLRWDRWRYESGDTAWGEDAAPLVFAANYRSPAPDVSAPIGPDEAVASRRGSDRSPIDPTTEAGRLALTSFVWPDQPDRHERLAAGLEAAAAVPAPIDRRDAAEWCEEQLVPVAGATTVLFHSIVWQYLSPDTKTRVTAAVEAAGAQASARAPMAWLRMEPGADPNVAAELRLRTWPGRPDLELLALSGYHGHPVWRA